jgi:hypothetical protein
VSVDADSHGRAQVWRRDSDGRVELTEHRFPNWFLTTSLELLAHLPAQRVMADKLRAAHGDLNWWHGGLCVVELEGAEAAEAAYRYLVLTDHLAEVETAMVEMLNKGDGEDAQSLADLRGLVMIWHPIEQFLLLTGRTYFKGLKFSDLKRLQFDLETTGLDDERDRIFMISLRDSSGWNECLDTESLSEAQMLERFVQIVQSRDPDVLENHNIFAFDLPFLVRRATRLGVPLILGRDGSEPEIETDVFDGSEPFLRWRVRGREVVDTQHAVRRYGMTSPDMRRHGLKEAARYFGLAGEDREYVPGVEIWPTYQTDPGRIRRYAAGDVEEVEALSSRLLPTAFDLAQMLPRAYERIAADCGPTALWEPLLVRAYLHEGRAIAAPMPRQQLAAEGPRAELRLRGVVGASVRATFPKLLPCVLASEGIHASNDDLRLLPRLLREALADPGALTENDRWRDGDAQGGNANGGEAEDGGNATGAGVDRGSAESGNAALAQAAFGYLGGQGLLADPQAGTEAARRASAYVERLESDLRKRGCTIVEADGAQVLCATPAGWDQAIERAVAEEAQAYLPDGVRVEFPGHYQALYTRAPHSAVMLGHDGSVTLVGTTFRPGRLERFGEDFIRTAAPLVLLGDVVGLRRAFTEVVHQLRTAQVALEDLCVLVTLHKSPPQYRRSGTHEEPYEVLLAAGVRSWRVGQRIRYFRTRGGEPRLLQEGDEVSPAEADAEYYVQRLVAMYCGQFAQAFRREDFLRLFQVPSGVGPFEESALEEELRGVRTVAEAVAPRALDEL